MKSFCIRDECWELELWVICPATNKEVDRFLFRQFGIKEKTRDGSFLGRFIEVREEDDEEIAGVIALRDWRGTPKDYDTLTHECLHAVHWFLTNRGIKLNFKSDESYCYLLGSFVRRIANQLNWRK